jgi:Heliorhodopsin
MQHPIPVSHGSSVSLPRPYLGDMPDPAPAQLDAAAASRLRGLNVIVGSVHALQAVVLLAIATAASLPITASFLIGPPGAGDYGAASLGSMRIDWLVAAFLALAAVDHLTLSGGRPRRWYEANVARGVNPARWWEYSVSASLMVVLIAMLAGVSELVALIALFGANAAMILFGLVQEQTNAGRDEVDWRPFVYGCVIGAAPWIAIAAQLIISATDGNGVPGFVVAIFVTLFLLFDTFAVNMWLQYRGRGRWADPAFAERVYLILSLAAKSALAWQVYVGALAGG